MKHIRDVILGLGLCVLIAGCGGGHKSSTPGPLTEVVGAATLSGSPPVRVGQYFDLTLDPPPNHGASDAVLEALEPADAGAAKGLTFRYAVVPAGKGCKIGAAYRWPPPNCQGRLKTLNGYRYRPGEQVTLLVGARAPHRGRWLIRKFRLRYHVGGTSYTATYTQGLDLHVTR